MKPPNIESEILLRNNIPENDFLGFSATEIHHLLYNTFGENSPLRFLDNVDNATFDKIPFFRIIEEFAKIVQRDKAIKLTPLGALTKKIMVELYSYKFILDEHLEFGISKLWREEDCVSIQTARHVAEISGLVIKKSNKLVLTKTGTNLLKPENRVQLFRNIFIAFVDRFNWPVHDRYTDYPVGQLGWAFSLFLVSKFGDKPRLTDFYAEKYLTAFPKFIDFFHRDFSTPQKLFMRCYSTRTFDRFFLWFGLVTVEKKNKFINFETDSVLATDMVTKIFQFDET